MCPELGKDGIGWNEVKRFADRETSRLKRPSTPNDGKGGEKRREERSEVKERHDGTGSPCEMRRSLRSAPAARCLGQPRGNLSRSGSPLPSRGER